MRQINSSPIRRVGIVFSRGGGRVKSNMAIRQWRIWIFGAIAPEGGRWVYIFNRR